MGRILLLADKPHRNKPEKNIEQLTCPAFQASCYLSPSPKGRKKVNTAEWRTAFSEQQRLIVFTWSFSSNTISCGTSPLKWKKKKKLHQLSWWLSEIFLFHISVSIWREHFSFLKNRESLLACFTLSSLLLTFLANEKSLCNAAQKCIVTFETRVCIFKWRDISRKRRRRILLLANKSHRDKHKQNIEHLTCLAFQASCYLSPSPEERKKVNNAAGKNVVKSC